METKSIGQPAIREGACKNPSYSLSRPFCDFKAPAKDTEDPNCLFKGHWLNKGNCGFLVSTSGVGKSSFSMQAAVHWAKGEPMLGICPTHPLKTIIFQAEDDEYDISNFISGIKVGLATELGWDEDTINEAEKSALVTPPIGFTNKELFDTMASEIRVHHPDLVILNPLHAFFDGSLNESHACSEFFRKGIDPIIKAQDTKCGIIIVHHTGKPKDSSQKAYLSYLANGSAELTNYPRSILAIMPTNDSGVYELVGAKHGDRLGWRDSSGRRTTRKLICYANRLSRYKENDDAIYWIEPTTEELLALHRHTTSDTSSGNEEVRLKKSNGKSPEENALALVKYVESNPSTTINNKSLREYAATQWMTQVARKAVKEFERIRCDHGIGKDKDSGCYIHGKPLA